MAKKIKKIPVMSQYALVCSNVHGPDSANGVTVINRRVSIGECKECKFFRGFNESGLYVRCSHNKRGGKR